MCEIIFFIFFILVQSIEGQDASSCRYQCFRLAIGFQWFANDLTARPVHHPAALAQNDRGSPSTCWPM